MAASPAVAEAEADADPPDAEAPPLTDEQIIEHFTFHVQSVDLRRSLRMDRHSGRNVTHRHMNLSLVVEYDPSVEPRAFGDVRVDHVVTSEGQSPEREARGGRRGELQRLDHLHTGGRHRAPDRSPEFTIPLNFEYPAGTPDKIARLAGSVQIEVASGEPQRARIGPYSNLPGRSIRIEGIEGSQIQFTFDRDDRLRLVISRPLVNRLAELAFETAEGNPVEHRVTRTYRGGGDGTTYLIDVDMPDDGRLVLELHSDVRQVRVPFELIDIELPTLPELAEVEQELVVEASDRPLAELLHEQAEGDESENVDEKEAE